MEKLDSFCAFCFILPYIYIFLISEGNDYALVDKLFKMILILSILVFFWSKMEIDEGKNEVMKQTSPFKYFRKKV